MNDVQVAGRDFSQEINGSQYNNARLTPLPGQELYLHLSDLRLALETVRTDAVLSLLDYGCGGSPYASLFPNAEYKRADYLSSIHLDYVLGADSRVPESDAVFDMILSTQVLEHVEQPTVYLSECHRLLKPRGQVVLTTHGTFPDHGCPYDYQRWTADGLRVAFEKSGFRVLAMKKLTLGPRALLFLLGSHVRWLYAPESTSFGIFLKLLRIILSRTRLWFQRNCDRHFAECRVRDAGSLADDSFYVGLFVVAQKT